MAEARKRRGSGALLLLWFAACSAPAPDGVERAGPPASEVPAAAPLDSAAGEVPFERAGPGGAALTVAVMVNGEGPFDFVLDTGATLTCIDQDVARRLGLREERRVPGIGAGMGAAGRLSLVRLDSLRVGGARAGELMACALDLGHVEAVGLAVDGLLGLNFLKAFRVTLDFERDVLLLRTP